MQKDKRFNKKKSVRFQLISGRDEHGNPTTTFRPVETKNRLSQKERNKIIKQISDSQYEVQIDGKMVSENQIPSYVLQQIKGRADLLFYRKNVDMFDQMQEENKMMRENRQEDDEEIMEEGQYDEQQLWDEDEEGEQIPEEQYMNYVGQEQQNKMKSMPLSKSEQKLQKKQVQVQGKKYLLTQNQIKMLDEVLPKNYQNYQINGVEFIKYDQDGNRLDIKQKYKKYIADPHERVGIVDSYEFTPQRPVDVVDNDLDGQVLKGDVKEIQDALNYEGNDDAYEQLQDDFFAKLVSGQNKSKNNKKSEAIKQPQNFKKKKLNQLVTDIKPQKVQKQPKKQPQKINKGSKLDQLDGIDYQQVDQNEQDYEDVDQQQNQYDEQQIYQGQGQQITDDMLDKAIMQFDGKGPNINKHKNKQQEEQAQRIPGTGVPLGTKGMDFIKFIEGRQGCIGKDGQLDWRTLTKKQKKQYMKNKKIRSAYQQIKQRQVQQKLRGKQNIQSQQLHLKQYIEHIPYNEDHVMQQAIERDQKQIVDIQAAQNEQDFETESDEDDIISYRAKTSIISSNLATVQQVSNKKNRKLTENKNNEQSQQTKNNIQKVKVVLQKRNRNETQQERKQRKQKLKQMKKQKKQQRKQFNQMFDSQRKKVMKKQNNGSVGNPLHKVSYVKIV